MVAAAGLQVSQPMVAGATAVSLGCAGITGDNASSLGDSKATLALLASVTGGGGLSFAAEITPTVPAKVVPSTKPFAVGFKLALTVPASLAKPAKDLLGLSSIEIRNASYVIAASGAATGTFTKTVPSQMINLSANPIVLSQSVSGSVTAKAPGAIVYRPGTSRLTLVINKSVAGVKINALTITCTSSKDIASTAVQVPGAPRVRQPMTVTGPIGKTLSLRLLNTTRVVPDGGNPFIKGSLVVTKQPKNGGKAIVKGDYTAFTPPKKTGTYVVSYKICANAKAVPAVPGVNTVQSMAWPESYVGRQLNAHPFAMSLKFKTATTPPIPLSYLAGTPSPTGVGNQTFADQFLAQFQAPSASKIQKALEALPTIGAGNVVVTGGSSNKPYRITFVKALGGSEQPPIEVVDWNTWLPADGLSKALALFNPAPAPTVPGQVTTTTAPKPVETTATLDAKLLSGRITFDQWLEGRAELFKSGLIGGLTTPQNIAMITKLFPKPPEPDVTTIGKSPIPATTTGPLCTAFTVSYRVTPA